MPQSIYNQKRDPTPKGINHCEMVCCVFCLPPTDHWELRKTSIKLKAHVLETIKVVERKRPVKELTCPLFWVSWGFKMLNQCLDKNWKTFHFNGLALHGDIWNGQAQKTDVWAVFFNYESGEWKKSHKDKPSLYFLFPTQKGPLLMRVPSWWSVGCGRSDGCTWWRGCMGGAVFLSEGVSLLGSRF